jgi:hypothetical protein
MHGNANNKNPSWLVEACQLALSNMVTGRDNSLSVAGKGGTLHIDGNGGPTKPGISIILYIHEY